MWSIAKFYWKLFGRQYPVSDSLRAQPKLQLFFAAKSILRFNQLLLAHHTTFVNNFEIQAAIMASVAYSIRIYCYVSKSIVLLWMFTVHTQKKRGINLTNTNTGKYWINKNGQLRKRRFIVEMKIQLTQQQLLKCSNVLQLKWRLFQTKPIKFLQ